MTHTSDPPPPGETDILERLKFCVSPWSDVKLAEDARREIEHLRAKLSLAEHYRDAAERSERELREALRPFAEAEHSRKRTGLMGVIEGRHFARAAELVPENT